VIWRACLPLFAAALLSPPPAAAQVLTQRGFADGGLFLFPQDAPSDRTRAVGDLRVRDEVFFKPSGWLQFAAGVDFRANSHDQVDDRWRLDVSDRGARRPRLALRRLSATFTRGPVTIDAGKQFIRWGKADVVTPTDRFAPRDFLDVIDTEFLPVAGVRAVAQAGADTFEAVWLPRFTPSRAPLLDQRWTVVPAAAASVPLVDGGATLPDGSQTGVRWSRVADRVEFSLSFFEGFNNLPTVTVFPVPSPSGAGPIVAVARNYPAIRTYGADAAVPTRLFTIKAEAAYFTSRQSGAAAAADNYVLYVVQVERQTGEWVFAGGYAGEAVTARRSTLTFAPDRGLTRAIVAHASYTIGPTRTIAFEGAVRQNADGVYAKAEYSQARGQHWRATIGGAAIAGRESDFLGQYRRNSHVRASLRYSF